MKKLIEAIVKLIKDFLSGLSSGTDSQKLADHIAKNSPGIGPKMLKMASKWFFHPEVTNLDYMVLIDFDYRETAPRLWKIDRKTGKSEVFKVAHGSNSDPDKDGRPTEFSNVSGSHQSSLGAMVTLNQYGKSVGGWSKFKYAMQLKGLQNGLNHNVKIRSIVFHSSNYVNDVKGKLIGDSWGCPAVSEATAQAIIAEIDKGALFFIYHKSLDHVEKPPEHFKSFLIEKGLALIKKWEGFRGNAYLDTGGVPTIGFGTTVYSSGNVVQLGQVITEREATEELLHHVEQTVVPALDRLLKVDLNSNQYNALVSFVYNIGTTAFANSTMLKYLNSGDFVSAANEFPRWKKDNGKVIQGLLNRRLDEHKLFQA